MTLPPPTIQYATPPPVSRRRTFSLTIFLASGASIAVLILLLVFAVPRVESIFADFGTKLPMATQLLLDVSRWAISWGWIPLCSVPFALALLGPLVVPQRAASRREAMLWIAIAVLATFCVMLVLIVVVLFLPILKLLEAISGP